MARSNQGLDFRGRRRPASRDDRAAFPRRSACSTGVEALESAGDAWRDLFIGIVADGVASGSFRAVDPDDLAEWYLPYLDGLALDTVTAGSHARVGTSVFRARRRLDKALQQRVPPR